MIMWHLYQKREDPGFYGASCLSGVCRWKSLALVVLAIFFFHPVNGGGTPYYNVFGFLRPNAGGPGGPGSNPISYVQSSDMQVVGGTDEVTLSFGQSPGAGNTVVVFVVMNRMVTDKVSVTDAKGNGYTRVAEKIYAPDFAIAMFVGRIVSSSAGFWVKVTDTNDSWVPQITASAVEYSGLSDTPLRASGCATGTTNSPLISITSDSSALLLGLIAKNHWINPLTFTPVSGIVRMNQTVNTTAMAGSAVENFATEPGSFDMRWNTNSLFGTWGACIIALR